MIPQAARGVDRLLLFTNLKTSQNTKEVNGLAVERRKLTDLVKANWNPRKITTEQQAALQRSLTEFGTVEPIVINRVTGNVVGGHQRLDALLANGETETDILVGEWSAEQEKALNIALNKISSGLGGGRRAEHRSRNFLHELYADRRGE